MASSALECGTCSQVFSEDRCPRLLPCSHTLCDHCINGIISSSQRKACPFCRKEFTASSPSDMMLIKSLLDVAKLVSFMHDEPKTPSKGPKRSMVKFTKDIRKKITKKGITECQKTRTQIMDDIGILNEMKNGALENYDKTEALIKELQKLQLSCASTLSHINQNTKVLQNSLDVMVQKEDKFKDFNAKLGAATDSTSAVVVMDEAKEVLEEVQEKVKEIKELLQKNEAERGRVEKSSMETKAEKINL
ncbi:E3 ubiquitin-protein ligase TRIM13-like [Palaemon carinicauda]|uniref:E3 ubiquitin-protein ligase TRIM13-like n=1 Tax=Palaemon carinicauda TaxID=392227 RepID=UPI0035B5A1E8